MPDSGPSGPHRDLWALPSEPLPPGAATFLQMARDLHAGIDGSPDFPDLVEEEATAEVVVLHRAVGQPVAGDDEAPGADPSPGGPPLKLVGAEPDSPEAADETQADEHARRFLEMVDRVDTVRLFPAHDGDLPPDWLWAEADDGGSAADVLLTTIEQAMRHVNQSEDIRNEELRAKLLDLFTDFAVRRPWKDEERPAAQRVNRLADRRDDGTGERSR